MEDRILVPLLGEDRSLVPKLVEDGEKAPLLFLLLLLGLSRAPLLVVVIAPLPVINIILLPMLAVNISLAPLLVVISLTPPQELSPFPQPSRAITLQLKITAFRLQLHLTITPINLTSAPVVRVNLAL